MSILILAKQEEGKLNPNVQNVARCAAKIGGNIDILIAGGNSTELQKAAEAAKDISGVTKIIIAENAAFADGLAENVAALVAELANNYKYVLSAATTYGKDILPRAAALCDAQQISEITEVVDAKTFKRPIFAGNAIATVTTEQDKIFLTVRVSNFEKQPSGGSATIEKSADTISNSGLSRFVSIEKSKSDRPELTTADIIVSGGRGVNSSENFGILEKLADKLGAAVGASRAAVDAGFVPNDYQVGQTGKIVAPNLYIAAGISGAIQHLAGMKDSKVIVAINKDENAPIFEVADIGIVADLFEVIPALTEKL